MAKHAPIFHAAAAQAGLKLIADVKLPWLTRHGHLAPAVQDQLPSWALAALDKILLSLDGDAAALANKTRGAMTADFLLDEIEVEYDEIQHFTSARIRTLGHYPSKAILAFDPATYRVICERFKTEGDKGFAHRIAAEFPGPTSRQRQRAYFDAFRDLAAPHFGNGPVLRIAAPDNNYRVAVRTLGEMVDKLAG